jgi:hypothetical protein
VADDDDDDNNRELWKVVEYTSILDKKLRTVDKGWYSRLGGWLWNSQPLTITNNHQNDSLVEV